MIQIDKIIELNRSKGKKGNFNTSINTDKAQTVWKSNVIGFDALIKYYGYDAKKILDVGCRVGVLSKFLMDLNYDVVGAEVVPEFIEDGKKNGIDIRNEDARNMSFKDNSFDAVFCRDMIEHVPDPYKVFNEIIRVVKPGGVVFLIGPIEPKPSVPSHHVSWKTLDVAINAFNSNLTRSIYFGLIEDEPVTNKFSKKMVRQSLKRETFLAFLEVI